ncbi:hypothetical protein ZWY2020_015210 [Hordeum vulgare]|nr:hypothetical protein ZWY2020_015210 [Hordeum vulgare]
MRSRMSIPIDPMKKAKAPSSSTSHMATLRFGSFDVMPTPASLWAEACVEEGEQQTTEEDMLQEEKGTTSAALLLHQEVVTIANKPAKHGMEEYQPIGMHVHEASATWDFKSTTEEGMQDFDASVRPKCNSSKERCRSPTVDPAGESINADSGRIKEKHHIPTTESATTVQVQCPGQDNFSARRPSPSAASTGPSANTPTTIYTHDAGGNSERSDHVDAFVELVTQGAVAWARVGFGLVDQTTGETLPLFREKDPILFDASSEDTCTWGTGSVARRSHLHAGSRYVLGDLLKIECAIHVCDFLTFEDRHRCRSPACRSSSKSATARGADVIIQVEGGTIGAHYCILDAHCT